MNEDPFNPINDLAEFARNALERHETMQAATRREAATNRDQEIRRTYYEMPAPKGFADPPQKKERGGVTQVTNETDVSPGGNFCEVFELEGTWYIRGGLVRVSTTKSFNIPDYEIATGTDGVKLIYIEMDVEANRDDDGDYFLPGLKTSSATSPEMEDTASADYPAGTEPDIATGLGTIILEVGVLTVTDGIPSLAPTGCGPFFLTHCAGNLSYVTRG